MTMTRMRSRGAVLEAMAEYDRLGGPQFLARHGFGPSRRYRLVHDGREYDSKAIVGVAHGYEFPAEGALTSGDFSGGVHGAAAVLARLGFDVVDGAGARTPADHTPAHELPKSAPVPAASPLLAGGPAADILLVGCVKGKRASASAARDLYTSDLFRKRLAYADATGLPWFILSALHGLVRQEDVIEPYDMALADQPAEYRRRWGERVVAALAGELGEVRGRVFEVHAGAAYADSIEDPLRRWGASMLLPVQGLSQGRQLQYYLTRPAEPVRAEPSAVADGASIAALLQDSAAARPALDFPWGETRFGAPGLYSWWVDPAGAEELSAGLGLPVSAGLIYAGQAGATTAVASVERAATLLSRIGRNHLRGRISSSTWRRSLAAVLSNQSALDFHAAPALAEQSLSRWMGEHLGLIAHPMPDRHTLARLESEVLQLLDPPFNLQGMPSTAARRTLSLLRSSLP